ncbi:Oxysterol binding protein [Ascosphaera acerosa]|nr:Oxysterol binding protein [Ascosphaera acerosa]
MLQGYNGQKCSFSTSLNVRQVGHAYLTLTPPATADDPHPAEEAYLITLPPLHIEGLIYASPYVELDKSVYITSSSGYISRVDFSGKGWLTGKKNSFVAHLWKAADLAGCADTKKALFKVEGQWSDAWVARGAKPGVQVPGGSSASSPSSSTSSVAAQPSHTGKGDRPEILRWATKPDSKHAAAPGTTVAPPITPLAVAPLAEQDLWESRRAWHAVTAAIEAGNLDAASAAKSKIENAQRELRRREKAEGRHWRRCFFQKVSTRPAVAAKQPQPPSASSLAPPTERGTTAETDPTSEMTASTSALSLGTTTTTATGGDSTAESSTPMLSPGADFERLAASIGFTEHLESERTSGFWRADPAALARKTAPPYHRTSDGLALAPPDAVPAPEATTNTAPGTAEGQPSQPPPRRSSASLAS